MPATPTPKAPFPIIIINVFISYFVCLSLRRVIKNRITFCLEFFFDNDILSYVQKYHSSDHPHFFSSNIYHKHYPNWILCHFDHDSLQRFVHHKTHLKIVFWIGICIHIQFTTIYCCTYSMPKSLHGVALQNSMVMCRDRCHVQMVDTFIGVFQIKNNVR